jgi:hypothetical protein
LEKRKRFLGKDHPDTLTSMNDLAMTYRSQGNMTEAAELLKELLEKRKRILGKEHPDTLASMNDLAWTYGRQGRIEEPTQLP